MIQSVIVLMHQRLMSNRPSMSAPQQRGGIVMSGGGGGYEHPIVVTDQGFIRRTVNRVRALLGAR